MGDPAEKSLGEKTSGSGDEPILHSVEEKLRSPAKEFTEHHGHATAPSEPAPQAHGATGDEGVNIIRGGRDALHSLEESYGPSAPEMGTDMQRSYGIAVDVPMDIDDEESVSRGAVGPGSSGDQAMGAATHPREENPRDEAVSAVAGGGNADAGGASEEEEDEDASFRAWAENAGDSDEGGEDAALLQSRPDAHTASGTAHDGPAHRSPEPENEAVGAGDG
ncbi:hypothetical protein T484DRAFT_1888859, partial [Baffinella frigidus]